MTAQRKPQSTLHITSGDVAGGSLKAAGLPGEVNVWHDLLYDGARSAGWPDAAAIEQRVEFIQEQTGGGLCANDVRHGMAEQYNKLTAIPAGTEIVLWFDACLFDQSMLVHILHCLKLQGVDQTHQVSLICVEKYPGIEPFHGLGQLRPEQLAEFYPQRNPVTKDQWEFAIEADNAFAQMDRGKLAGLSRQDGLPLPWIAPCAARWLAEFPAGKPGYALLRKYALLAVRAGNHTPKNIFNAAAELDTPPQYWGDTTLWGVINQLSTGDAPQLKIDGPTPLLPLWITPDNQLQLQDYTINCM